MKSFYIAIAVCVTLTGCSTAVVDRLPADAYQAEADITVLMAFAGFPTAAEQADDVQPEVGDDCPQCNDPPGKCGVGKVGDGNVCQPCRKCGGDGRIDRRDVSASVVIPGVAAPVTPAVPPLPAIVKPVKIVLHVSTESAKGWAKTFWETEADQFRALGHEVVFEKEASGPAWLMVCAVDGRYAKIEGSPTADQVFDVIRKVQ